MSCFLVNEKNELYKNIGLIIEEFKKIELKNGELWINDFVHIPTDKILEIKIKEGDD